MAVTKELSPGMTITLEKKIFRVETTVKVKAKRGTPFIKTKLRNLATEEIIEKNFKVGQEVDEVALSERNLEYLYPEGKGHLFLDIDNLETMLVPPDIIGDKVNYLKEGIQVKASLYGVTVFAVELPMFLELMVAETEELAEGGAVPVSNATKMVILETGAKIETPPFVEVGDIIKVDTRTGEYIQRV